MVVEKQLALEGVSRRDLGREKFVERVWEWKAHSGGTIQRQMRILGDSVDWTRERFTMDEGLSNAVKEVFVRLYDEGLIYRGEYMVNWSPGLQTAISDLEVEMKQVKGKLYHIAYPVGHAVTSRVEGLAEAYAGADRIFRDGSKRLTATSSSSRRRAPKQCSATRPSHSTLKTNAIALSPARARRCRWSGARLPFIQDEVVEKDFGTGFVKVTPAHDPNDFAMGRRHNLEFIQVIGKDARITDAAPEKYRGLDRYEARKQVVADLEALGLLLKTEDYTHNVGHCQRSGVAIEPLVSTQWFMRMKPLGRACDRGGARRQNEVRARKRGEDLFQLARKHSGLVRLPPVVVGPSHSRVVHARRGDRRRARRAGGAAKIWPSGASIRTSPCAKKRTCSTPGSRRSSGPSRRSDGPTRPKI